MNSGPTLHDHDAAAVQTLVKLPRSRRSEEACDLAAQRLADGGFRETLSKFGLILWQVLPTRTRGGERIFLTLSLPPDPDMFTREGVDAVRRATLEHRLASAEKCILSEASRILGVEEARVGLAASLIESCCGAGCEPCLLAKNRHSQHWTGLAPCRIGDAR